MRVGMGYDVHKLVEGRDLIIGGVRIPHTLGLLGHSDADVLLHAIMDALLGAAGLGDIGKHFPDTDPQYKGISSMKLLSHVAELIRERGYSLWEGSDAELALSDRWSVSVTILPGISAFVGADIVAGIYALEMDRKKNALLLDIGTNGEMAAGGADGFLVTSAAAGPVFEGGNISCGVAGVPGAVTSLVLERDPAAIGGIRTVELSTIAGETPIGLCGTGIIDAVGEAVRLGLIDENGTFEEPWFTDGMPVAEGRFRFRQEDVRQVQMGKAAIRAGIETLLAEYGGGDPEEILIAGGFGCRMDEEQTIRIGLFPEQFRGHITMIGNSALAGAQRYLLDDRTAAKQRLASITGRAQELSLAMHPKFNELYLDEMFFDTDR